jgi:hypothetical protein
MIDLGLVRKEAQRNRLHLCLFALLHSNYA